MKPSIFSDILDRVAENPSWWCRGVPRYGAFHPSKVDTYGSGEVLLVAVACQNCGHEGLISATGPGKHWTFQDRIDVHASIGVGNSPFGCCGFGHLFCLFERKIEEFWTWQDGDWLRQSALEGPLLDDQEDHVLCLEEKLKPAGVYTEWEAARAAFDIHGLIALLPHLGLPEERVEQIARNWQAVVRDIDEMFQPLHAARTKETFFDRGFPCEPWCAA